MAQVVLDELVYGYRYALAAQGEAEVGASDSLGEISDEGSQGWFMGRTTYVFVVLHEQAPLRHTRFVLYFRTVVQSTVCRKLMAGTISALYLFPVSVNPTA